MPALKLHALRSRRAIAIAVAAAIVLALHLTIVASIVRQPLEVSYQPAEQRSLIWPFHHDAVHRLGPGSDFFALYHAAIQQQRGLSPYDVHEKPQVSPRYYPFRYLPIVPDTLGRLAICFDGRTAWQLWVCVLELVLAATLYVGFREARGSPWRWPIAAALLLSSPYMLELHIGQFTFASCALLAIGLVLLDRAERDGRRYAIGGTAAFAAAVLLKVFPLAAGAALLRRRTGFVALAATGILVVASTLPYFVASTADANAFWQKNFGATGTEGFHGGNYGFVYSTYVALRYTLGDGAARGFTQVMAGWQLLVLATTAALVIWKKPAMVTGGIALALAHMISYKQVWEHHASGAVVLAAFLLLQVSRDRGRLRWAVLACLIVLALPTPFVFVDAHDVRVYDPFGQWPKIWQFLLPASKGVPTFALWIFACVRTWREAAAHHIAGVKPALISAKNGTVLPAENVPSVSIPT